LFLGGQNEPFSEILDIAEQMNCSAFVFSPFDIDWSKDAVWGYINNGKLEAGEWQRRVFPLPTVIYNRIPNRTLENREDIKKILLILKRMYGPCFFNPCFLDKWKTHTILYENERSNKFLPETRRLFHPANITEMMHKYPSVYLKPTANSLGNGIFKISRASGGLYRFSHQTLNEQQRKGLFTHAAELFPELPATGETPDILIQQAIPLAEIGGQPFDLRLLVQKNRHGQWKKTGMAARVAGNGSITTHVLYGGTRLPAAEAIREAASVHGFSLKKVKKKLVEIQTYFPRIIEKAYGSSFGELEMDVGIDKKGGVWFFEANSKPFRFDEKLIRAKSLVRLIHYVHFLDASRFNRPPAVTRNNRDQPFGRNRRHFRSPKEVT